MTDTALSEKRAGIRATVEKRLAARYRAERRFQAYGIAAVTVAVMALAVLVVSISITGVPARDTDALVARAAKRGVLVDNGAVCYMTPPDDAILLMSSTACPAAHISEGVSRLAKALADI